MDMQISVFKYKFVTLKIYMASRVQQTLTLVLFPGYVNCSQAFLFSLVNTSGLGPTKLSLITGKEGYGIVCGGSYGPAFGDGNDLYISDNANTNYSSSRLGNTYQVPPGQYKTFSAGATNFFVTDYEVFGFQQ